MSTEKINDNILELIEKIPIVKLITSNVFSKFITTTTTTITTTDDDNQIIINELNKFKNEFNQNQLNEISTDLISLKNEFNSVTILKIIDNLNGIIEKSSIQISFLLVSLIKFTIEYCNNNNNLQSINEQLLHITILKVINQINDIQELVSVLDNQLLQLLLKLDSTLYPTNLLFVNATTFTVRSQSEGPISDLEFEYYPELVIPIEPCSERNSIYRVDAQIIRQDPKSELDNGRIYTFKKDSITNCIGQFLSNKLSIKMKLTGPHFKNKSISIRLFSMIHSGNDSDINNSTFDITFGNNSETIKMVSTHIPISNHQNSNITRTNVKTPYISGYSETTKPFSSLSCDPILNIKHNLSYSSTDKQGIIGRLLFVEFIILDV